MSDREVPADSGEPKLPSPEEERAHTQKSLRGLYEGIWRMQDDQEGDWGKMSTPPWVREIAFIAGQFGYLFWSRDYPYRLAGLNLGCRPILHGKNRDLVNLVDTFSDSVERLIRWTQFHCHNDYYQRLELALPPLRRAAAAFMEYVRDPKGVDEEQLEHKIEDFECCAELLEREVAWLAGLYGIRYLDDRASFEYLSDPSGWSLCDCLFLEEEATGTRLPTKTRTRGKVWIDVQQRAEKIVKAKRGFPGVRALCATLNCSPQTLYRAIRASASLNARYAEYISISKGNHDDATLHRLVRESQTENEADPSPVSAHISERQRSRKA